MLVTRRIFENLDHIFVFEFRILKKSFRTGEKKEMSIYISLIRFLWISYHATLCERFYLCERFAEFTRTADGEDRQIGATQFDISVRGYH